jgi:hypothetical protein
LKQYAKGTEVPIEKSEAEIRALVRQYGAEDFISGNQGPTSVVAFRRKGVQVRFLLTMPKPSDPQFAKDGRGSIRTYSSRQSACDAEIRRAWRAFALVIKAKLEAVSTGISTFESEFLAHVVLPNGRTIGEEFLPQVEQMRLSGASPQLLLPGVREARTNA